MPLLLAGGIMILIAKPKSSISGHFRVIRAGSWYFSITNLRSAHHYRYSSTVQNNNQGFRLIIRKRDK